MEPKTNKNVFISISNNECFIIPEKKIPSTKEAIEKIKAKCLSSKTSDGKIVYIAKALSPANKPELIKVTSQALSRFFEDKDAGTANSDELSEQLMELSKALNDDGSYALYKKAHALYEGKTKCEEAIRQKQWDRLLPLSKLGVRETLEKYAKLPGSAEIFSNILTRLPFHELYELKMSLIDNPNICDIAIRSGDDEFLANEALLKKYLPPDIQQQAELTVENGIRVLTFNPPQPHLKDSLSFKKIDDPVRNVYSYMTQIAFGWDVGNLPLHKSTKETLKALDKGDLSHLNPDEIDKLSLSFAAFNKSKDLLEKAIAKQTSHCSFSAFFNDPVYSDFTSKEGVSLNRQILKKIAPNIPEELWIDLPKAVLGAVYTGVLKETELFALLYVQTGDSKYKSSATFDEQAVFTFITPLTLISFNRFLEVGASLNNYYPEAWDNPFLSDITVNNILANKELLSSKSSYFQAMFSSGMKESRKSDISIKDHPHLPAIIRFMYTGHMDISPEHLYGIYQEARFFGIEELTNFVLLKFAESVSHFDNKALQVLFDISRDEDSAKLNRAIGEEVLRRYQNSKESIWKKNSIISFIQKNHKDGLFKNVLALRSILDEKKYESMMKLLKK